MSEFYMKVRLLTILYYQMLRDCSVDDDFISFLICAYLQAFVDIEWITVDEQEMIHCKFCSQNCGRKIKEYE